MENNGLRGQFDHNFDYVTCCGGNASGSVGKGVGENGFFIRRAGYLIQNASGGLLYRVKIIYRILEFLQFRESVSFRGGTFLVSRKDLDQT